MKYCILQKILDKIMMPNILTLKYKKVWSEAVYVNDIRAFKKINTKFIALKANLESLLVTTLRKTEQNAEIN